MNRKRNNSYIEDSCCSDIIYYNIIITGASPITNNASVVPVLAEFEENRVQAIVDKMSDYYMSVVRFSIDGTNVPIFICPVIPNPNDSTDVNFTPFIVTLSCNGVDYTQNLRYYTEVANLNPTPPTMYGQDNSKNYYYIYQYTTFINMLNNAINICFNNLVAANTQYTGKPKPYFQYNKTLQLIEYIVPNIIINSMNTYLTQYVQPISPTDTNKLIGTPIIPQPVNTIYLYMNEQLYQYYNGIEAYEYESNATKTFLMTARDLLNNYYYYPQNLTNSPSTQIMTSFTNTYPPYTSASYTSTPEYFINKQEYNIIQLWNSISGIVLLTSSIPVQAEYVPSSAYTNAQGNSGVASFRPILTDFVPNLERAGEVSSKYIYYPTQYRFIQLLSDLPLTKFDVKMYWQDQKQKLYPLYISYNQSNTIKFMFIRKSLIKNYTLKANN
jgi:hypothetical protein